MYRCVNTWVGKANAIVDNNGKVRVLEVSQFADDKTILGKTWDDITLSYEVREKFVEVGWTPEIGRMWYTIDALSGVFAFMVGTVDSSD